MLKNTIFPSPGVICFMPEHHRECLRGVSVLLSDDVCSLCWGKWREPWIHPFWKMKEIVLTYMPIMKILTFQMFKINF